MADENEFGGVAEEIAEEELPEGMRPVDIDAVDEVDDADVVTEDADTPLVKPSPLDEDDQENAEEETDIEEASYFFDEDKGFDAR